MIEQTRFDFTRFNIIRLYSLWVIQKQNNTKYNHYDLQRTAIYIYV